MKKLFVLLPLLFGCTSAETVSNNQVLVTAEAVSYINFSETTHRKELKELTGVDPVSTEWCAAFVNAVLRNTGIPGSETVSEYPLTARSFLQWGSEVEYPETGDIVVFPRGNQGWQGHVGFYLQSQTVDGVLYYWILGGNQNDEVSIEMYRASTALSVRRYRGGIKEWVGGELTHLPEKLDQPQVEEATN